MQGLYRTLSPVTLSSAKDPAGYPDKNSNNRKIESAQGTMGRGKSGSEAFLLSFPFPSSPARFLFLSLQSSLQYQEASAEERGPVMIDNDLANDYLLFTVMWFTAEKVRRYKFIVCLFVFLSLPYKYARDWNHPPSVDFSYFSYLYAPVNDTFLVQISQAGDDFSCVKPKINDE